MKTNIDLVSKIYKINSNYNTPIVAAGIQNSGKSSFWYEQANSPIVKKLFNIRRHFSTSSSSIQEAILLNASKSQLQDQEVIVALQLKPCNSFTIFDDYQWIGGVLYDSIRQFSRGHSPQNEINTAKFNTILKEQFENSLQDYNANSLPHIYNYIASVDNSSSKLLSLLKKIKIEALLSLYYHLIANNIRNGKELYIQSLLNSDCSVGMRKIKEHIVKTISEYMENLIKTYTLKEYNSSFEDNIFIFSLNQQDVEKLSSCYAVFSQVLTDICWKNNATQASIANKAKNYPVLSPMVELYRDTKVANITLEDYDKTSKAVFNNDFTYIFFLHKNPVLNYFIEKTTYLFNGNPSLFEECNNPTTAPFMFIEAPSYIFSGELTNMQRNEYLLNLITKYNAKDLLLFFDANNIPVNYTNSIADFLSFFKRTIKVSFVFTHIDILCQVLKETFGAQDSKAIFMNLVETPRKIIDNLKKVISQNDSKYKPEANNNYSYDIDNFAEEKKSSSFMLLSKYPLKNDDTSEDDFLVKANTLFNYNTVIMQYYKELSTPKKFEISPEIESLNPFSMAESKSLSMSALYNGISTQINKKHRPQDVSNAVVAWLGAGNTYTNSVSVDDELFNSIDSSFVIELRNITRNLLDLAQINISHKYFKSEEVHEDFIEGLNGYLKKHLGRLFAINCLKDAYEIIENTQFDFKYEFYNNLLFFILDNIVRFPTLLVNDTTLIYKIFEKSCLDCYKEFLHLEGFFLEN